jgi:DNA-binding response OmpR family regulator
VVSRIRIHREPRVITRCGVRFERLDHEVYAESEDLSKRGVFVRTDELLPVGAVTELTVTLPMELEFRVIARVAHLMSPSSARALGRHPGMGFEFLETDNLGHQQLIAYLDDLLEELTPPPSSLPEAARCVVVDPSQPLLERLRGALEVAGFVVDCYSSSAEAYQACALSPPNVILTAADFPGGVDGWTLVKTMAANPRLVEVPVVFMSEDGSDMTRLQAYRLGVRDFVHKPFIEEELVIRLHRLVLSQPRGIGESVMLRGNVAEISVATLLSLLEFERKSGILLLLREGDIARLFVASGRVVKVESRTLGPARERAMSILDWTTGNFEFTGCEVVGTDEIGLATSVLLIEHARIRDEEKHT